MGTSFDLNVLPLARQAGQDQPGLTGLHVAGPPRRPARGRATDRLILYLDLAGNAPLSPGKMEQILVSLAKAFYDTSGSMTAALRAVAEGLNRFLLDRNVRSASTGRQSVGLLSLAAVRGEQLYLAQCGPVHAFLITAGQTQHLHDPQITGRGLGLSRATPIRFFQASLQPNDILLLSTQPPPSWSEASLTGLHGQGPESLSRRLLNPGILDVNAILIQARPGAGKNQVLRSGPSAGPAAEVIAAAPQAIPRQADRSVPAPALPQAALEQEAPTERVESRLPSQGKPQSEELAAAELPVEPQPDGTVKTGAEAFRPAPQPFPPAAVSIAEPTPAEKAAPRPAPPARPKLSFAPFWRLAIAVGRPVTRFSRGLARTSSTFLSRMLPDESLFSISSTTMAFIAVAVPLVIVTVASMVYFQRGRDAQYNLFFAQAVQAGSQADGQAEVSARRTTWETALTYLDQAERFRTTTDSQGLRRQAQQALDELDLIRRPDYKPAVIGGLPLDVRITDLALSENELYMLDANSGSVVRAQFTSQGYEVDRSFQCGPDLPAGSGVGPLIDIAPWPDIMTPEATLLGMDAGGNLIYCGPRKAPVAATLAPPSAMQLGELVGFALDLTDLYVLDPDSNAVWVYWNSTISSQPQFFFGEDIPPMQAVVDLAVNSNDLYLLHADGHVTLCVYSGLGVAPTRCTDPVPYVDSRPEREGTQLVPENPFTQIRFSPPPDPSLYLMEPKNQGIYHFSLRNLVFQHQYLPAIKLSPNPATAFAVNKIERTFFLAIGNEVYYANIP